ncbi:hypothetical protein [Gemmata sp.]|uniref:hypothetical protein n=1 Tax=Gemmata sp. TaxID=1914242 RepID=UPI003F731073
MPEVLNLFDQAERLGVNPDWLRQLARDGRVPYLPAGSRLLFNPAAVTAALAQLATELQPPKPKRSRRVAHVGA